MGKAKQKPLKGEVKGSILTVAHKTANTMYELFPAYDEWYEMPDWLAIGVMISDERVGFEDFVRALPERHVQNLFAHGYIREERTEDMKFSFETTSKFRDFAKKVFAKMYDKIYKTIN